MQSNEPNYVDRLMRLAALLKQCDAVTRLDRDDRIEAETLAHALLDIDESCQAFTSLLLPRLEGDPCPSPDDVLDILLDITESLRHVVYHIGDSCFLSHLLTHEGS